jgi:four helix bundle protein
MAFGHEKLDVYKLALEYVADVFQLSKRLEGSTRHARDQLLRASQSIPLNIAEGNGKALDGDRRRFFEIARGSVFECAAIQDVLEVCGAIAVEENVNAKEKLDRLAAMLTKLGGRAYSVRDEVEDYGELPR